MDQNNQDQADLLRKQMDEIHQNESEELETTTNFDPETTEIDILNLPPRSVVHDEKKAKLKWKINLAFLRFIIILLLIVAVLVLTFDHWADYFMINSL